MKDRRARLPHRIRDELVNLDRVIGRVTEGWRRSKRSADDYYLDGVALDLHGWYAGLERIFEACRASRGGAWSPKPATRHMPSFGRAQDGRVTHGVGWLRNCMAECEWREAGCPQHLN
jgi:hypothetical protein